MSGSSPTPLAHTSVFNALGSYADRIKENTNKPSGSSSTSPNGPVTPLAPSSSAAAKQSSTPLVPKPKSLAFPPADPEDDGRWETVQTGRHRPRNEDKHGTGSDSKNWRERAVPKEPSGEDDSGAKVTAKSKDSAGKSGAAGADKAGKPRASMPISSAPAIGSKSVWGSLGGQSSNRTSASPSVNQSPTAQPVQPAIQEATIPTSPSLNGTTVTNNSTSPNLSSETTLPTSTPPNGPVTATNPTSTKPAPTPAPRIAAMPAVNPWEERKKKMAPSVAPTETSSSISSIPIPSSLTSSSSGRILQFGSVSPPQPALKSLPNGHASDDRVKKASAQKQKKGASSSVPAIAGDVNPSLWPDIAQAAEASKVVDEKNKVKERKDSETSTAVDESPATGKKTKWTAIPADELQAAADEAAENIRRQAAARRKAAKAESSASPAKGKSRKSSMESRKDRLDSGSLRLPPMPANATKNATPTFRPVFGTATSDAASSVEEVTTTMSAPLSRQTSRQSVGQSSRLSRTQLPSPSSQALNLDVASMRLGAGPFGTGKNTIPSAPLPAPQFPTANGAGQFTRPPRNREGRQSFSGPTGPVGRGGGRGFRSSSGHRGPKGFASPPGALRGLPSDNLYARGYGMGYGFVPPMGPMTYGANAQYEAWNAQYSQFAPQRGAMPPPPMPVTMVGGLDPLRVYVLGQVEYYFSMQNLAMDFFLRQQMDSEGWIDIPTIASFNRVKNLTADVPLVKEVMQLSSLLEVREDKVRLAYGESKRWVLPEAKPSSFPADPLESFQTMSPPSDAATAELAMSISGLGIEEMPGSGNMNGSAVGSLPKFASGEVENALMKSVPPSSSASVLNGEGSTGKGETMTPATSMSGDREEEESSKEETT